MTLRSTYTYVELEVSAAAYDEIAGKLRAADYDHAFNDGTIDMHGIGLTKAAYVPLVPAVPIADDPVYGDIRRRVVEQAQACARRRGIEMADIHCVYTAAVYLIAEAEMKAE